MAKAKKEKEETTRTLFQISDDLLALKTLIEEVGGDITDESTERAIDDWLNALENECSDKVDDYCALYKHYEAMARARQDEAERIAAMVKADNKAARKLKERLFVFFQNNEIEKMETLRFKVSVKANGGNVPVILTADAMNHPEELPEQYRRVKFEPDMDAIRRDCELLDAMTDAITAQVVTSNGLLLDKENILRAQDLADTLEHIGQLGTRGKHIEIR